MNIQHAFLYVALSCVILPATLWAKAPTFEKVVIVVFENASEDVALKQPTFKEIASKGVFFSNFHAVTRPSMPNYFAMTAANTFGIKSDAYVSLNQRSIVNLLDEKKYTWKVYAENYPIDAGCFTGEKSADGLYVHNHNPFVSYTYITEDPNGRCKQIVNAQNHFVKDVKSNKLSNFSFYIPNVINNGHSGSDKILSAEKWLKEFLYPIMKSGAIINNKILFILTFDEGNNNPLDPEYAANQIYTVFYGPMVNNIVVSERYDFYNMLRTLENEWQLGTLGQFDQSATSITAAIWKAN